MMLRGADGCVSVAVVPVPVSGSGVTDARDGIVRLTLPAASRAGGDGAPPAVPCRVCAGAGA